MFGSLDLSIGPLNCLSLVIMWFIFFFLLKDPGGLTDYIAAEYIPDFLGGPYEVRRTVSPEKNPLVKNKVNVNLFKKKINPFSCVV